MYIIYSSVCFFFFKQKTAYEMRISDWSSDVCSSDLTFTELRADRLGQAGYTAVALTGAALRSQVRQLAAKYDDIIIDVGGRDTGSLRAALTVADTLLVPVQPRSFDVWALDQVAALVAEAREINEG